MKAGFATLGILSLLLVSLGNAQQIYKWKDEKGAWHFSQTPPSGTQTERLQTASPESGGCKGEFQTVNLDKVEAFPEQQLITFTEVRLNEIDCGRPEAQILNDLSEVWVKLAREAARLRSPNTAEINRELSQSRRVYCEKEATWRSELSKIEAVIKKRHGGIFPVWVTQNRNWQRLDQAAKRDTVRISAAQCRQVYKD